MLKHLLSKKNIIVSILILLILGISSNSIIKYFELKLSLSQAGLLLIPFVIYVKYPNQKSSRYIWGALFFIILNLIHRHPIFLFFSSGCLIFFVLEMFYGKLNELSFLLLILITPLTKYFFDIFGFPIRLWLTDLSSSILNIFKLHNLNNGSVITIEGKIFSVDAACAGLKMVITSFVLAFLFIAQSERKHKLSIKPLVLIGYLIFVLALIILNNLIRIVTLIVLKSDAETFMHQFIGIAGLFLIVIFPLYFISNWLIKKTGITIINKKKASIFSPILISIISVTLSIILLFFNLQKDQKQEFEDKTAEQLQINNCNKTILDNKIVKFETNGILIYVKPGTRFYGGDHSPFICWRGSGYSLTAEQTIEIAGYEIFIANLKLNNQHYYTVWWYDNGKHKTISQLDWRYRTLKGEETFRIINVTGQYKPQLIEVCENLLQSNLFD